MIPLAKRLLRTVGCCMAAAVASSNPSLAILFMSVSFIWAEFIGIIEDVIR